MAQVHNQIRGASSILAGIARSVAMDQESGVERLSETLTPVIDVWRRPEWSFLRNEILGWMHVEDAGVALNNSSCGIRNPADSNYIVVVKRIWVRLSTAGQIEVRKRPNGTVDTAVANFVRDSRVPGEGISQRTTLTVAAITGGGPVLAPFVGTGVSELYEIDAVLAPGTELLVWAFAQAVSIFLDALYYERVALPGELT